MTTHDVEVMVRWMCDVEELRGLVQRYSRAIDARDFDRLAALFHPDAVIEGMRGTSPVGEYLDGMRDTPPAFETSMHVLGDPLVTLGPGADTGQLDTYGVVHQLRAAGDERDDLVLGMRYLDDVLRHEGRWVVVHRRAVNLWMRSR